MLVINNRHKGKFQQKWNLNRVTFATPGIPTMTPRLSASTEQISIIATRAARFTDTAMVKLPTHVEACCDACSSCSHLITHWIHAASYSQSDARRRCWLLCNFSIVINDRSFVDCNNEEIEDRRETGRNVVNRKQIFQFHLIGIVEDEWT